jgi:hypothetical protein
MRLLRSVQQTARPGPDRVYGKPADQCSTIQLYFRNTGKPRIAQDTREDHSTPGKESEWSALEKPVAPLTESAACRKKHLLELAKGFEPPTL